jgi:hypothetical protein
MGGLLSYMALIETKKKGGKGVHPGEIREKKGRRRGNFILLALGVTCCMLLVWAIRTWDTSNRFRL